MRINRNAHILITTKLSSNRFLVTVYNNCHDMTKNY